MSTLLDHFSTERLGISQGLGALSWLCLSFPREPYLRLQVRKRLSQWGLTFDAPWRLRPMRKSNDETAKACILLGTCCALFGSPSWPPDPRSKLRHRCVRWHSRLLE